MSERTDAMVFEALAATGVPGTHLAWPKADRPAKPRYRYRMTDAGETHASDANYSALPRYRVILEADEYDPEIVEAFDAAIATIGPYEYGEDWDYDEACIVHIWDFTVCEG